MREIKGCWVTVAPPSGGNHGSVTEAWWYVTEAGEVCLCSESGVASGPKEKLTVGGSDRAVASRLRRQSYDAENGTSDFHRVLSYDRRGVA
jgi:hypothetical protein